MPKKKTTKKPRTPRLPKVDFDAVLKSIVKLKGKGATADDVWLDHFERAYNFELPPSYRQFVRKFGSGRLSGWCEIFSAGPPNTDWGDLFWWNRVYWENMAGNVDDKTFKYETMDMVLFGRIWSGEEYGFRKREITQKKPREYAIYAIARHYDEVIKLADSFPQFIQDFCMGDGLMKFCQFDPSDFDYQRNGFLPIA
jgi:hypothetical protein